MTTLEEQFAVLIAGVSTPSRGRRGPITASFQQQALKSKTVYSVGEAISGKRKGAHAKLGPGSNGDSGARR